MSKDYMRFSAVVFFSLAVFSTSGCARQEPPTLEELDGVRFDRNDRPCAPVIPRSPTRAQLISRG